ncbi:peptidylprolyl isomerase [Algoriphagus vanfongensis]|uniref:peptidylprolyl isomerase n=1 Tax=Algoriphagus vanfongensis TaxID=426371 RepID=UPI000423F1C6|nr:peptidylprolyl isomerase [Algoriphagus vanfongensis]
MIQKQNFLFDCRALGFSLILSLAFWLCLLHPTTAIGQAKSAIGKIETPHGTVWIELDDRTPKHKGSFIQLAEAGYWDSLTFNRVIPNFVAQGGCPDTPEGFTDPEYLLNPEFHPDLTHSYGAVGAGGDDNPGKLSARCQFYIVQNKEGLHRLDGDYTVFGRVISGMEYIDEIVHLERDSTDMPLDPVTLDVSIVYLTEPEISQLKTQNP